MIGGSSPDRFLHMSWGIFTDKISQNRVVGISHEERVVLKQVRPESIGQARRVEGVR